MVADVGGVLIDIVNGGASDKRDRTRTAARRRQHSFVQKRHLFV
jgi:hypothetical protein